MKREYVTFKELISGAGMAETTARRYIGIYKEYLPTRKVNKTTKYGREAIQALIDISNAYDKKQSVAEIKEMLASKYPQTIDVEDVPTQPVTQSINNDLIIAQGQAILAVLDRIADAIDTINRQNERITQLEQRLNEIEGNATTRPPQRHKRSWWAFGRKKD